MHRILLCLTFTFALLAPLLPTTDTASAASIDSNISWNEVLHNSSDSVYRTQGPIMPGDMVRLRLRTAQSDLTSVRVRVWDDLTKTEIYNSMILDADFDFDSTIYDWWYNDISLGSQPTDLYYFFELNDQSDQDFYVSAFQGDPLGNMIDFYDDRYSFKIDVGDWNPPSEDAAPVPEPSTFILLAAGLAGAVALRSRLKRDS